MTSSWGYLVALAIPVGGMVYLWLRQRTLHARVITLASELDQRTTELEEAKQTLNRLAGLDTVTSLANHSAFQEFLRDEWRRALREASSISVLIIDIDRFSEYNDQLGHQLGDECLVEGRWRDRRARAPSRRPCGPLRRRAVRGRDVAHRPAGRLPGGPPDMRRNRGSRCSSTLSLTSPRV